MTKVERLTDCEEMVMKTVWDAERELGLMDITQGVNEVCKKNWKPQTVSTFLARLVRKGYLKHDRRGRLFFYHILISREKYVAKRANEFIEFWNHGNAAEFLTALMEARNLKTEEKEEMKKLLLNDISI